MTRKTTYKIRPTASGRYSVWCVWPSARCVAGDRPLADGPSLKTVEDAAAWIRKQYGDDAVYEVAAV